VQYDQPRPTLVAVPGWSISVYRLIDSQATREALTHPAGARPLDLEPPTRERIAAWQTGLSELESIEQLVESQGVTLEGGGRPSMYLLRAGDLGAHIEKRPPHETTSWPSGEHEVVLHVWETKPTVDEAALRSCAPGEWLLVEVWDEG
jgi:hypothetical protein